MRKLILKDVPPSVELVWHYSKVIHLSEIMKSGKLLPATAGVPASEKPVLWFSSSPVYPPSACMGTFDPVTGQARTMSVVETAASCGGVIRFCVRTQG